MSPPFLQLFTRLDVLHKFILYNPPHIFPRRIPGLARSFDVVATWFNSTLSFQSLCANLPKDIRCINPTRILSRPSDLQARTKPGQDQNERRTRSSEGHQYHRAKKRQEHQELPALVPYYLI